MIQALSKEQRKPHSLTEAAPWVLFGARLYALFGDTEKNLVFAEVSPWIQNRKIDNKVDDNTVDLAEGKVNLAILIS